MKIPSKILVFRQSSLGDVILTLPVVKELARAFPEAQIDYLTKVQYAPVVKHDPRIVNVIIFKDNTEFREKLKRVRSEKYDLIIDLQKNLRSISLLLCSLASRTIRYKKRRLAREMIVRKPRYNLKVDHTVNAYFHVLRRLQLNAELSPPEITLPPEAVQFSDDFIAGSFPESPSTLIALCPGAKHYEKKWPHENFREVARILLEDPSLGLFVITASTDSLPKDLDISNHRVVPVLDFGILEVAALLSRCEVALTNDSGLMHLANAVGTRVAAIFGPTSPRLGFSPTLPGSLIISSNVFCSPCSLHGEKPCRQPGKYCFDNIIPSRVANTITNMLKK